LGGRRANSGGCEFFLVWRARREVFFFCWLLVFTSAAISD
jgi:hypothetical protein